jgi:hypothetical protein
MLDVKAAKDSSEMKSLLSNGIRFMWPWNTRPGYEFKVLVDHLGRTGLTRALPRIAAGVVLDQPPRVRLPHMLRLVRWS